MSKPITFEGPDGRIYQIPSDVMSQYAVPPEKVAEVRKTLGAPAAPDGGMPSGHFRPGEAPPGYPPPPTDIGPGAVASGASTTTTVPTPNGGAIVLNFFFGPGGPGLPAGGPHATAAPTQVEGYHMTFDSHGIPTNHHELLWGDYIDKQGNPAVGWHSHDPVSGNAQ